MCVADVCVVCDVCVCVLMCVLKLTNYKKERKKIPVSLLVLPILD